MNSISGVIKKGSKSAVMEARGESDTLKLWESHREQATLWRTIALFQFISFPLLVLFSFYVYSTRSITLHVPPKPLPGHYSANEIPDSEFISNATNFVNLIASFQPKVARKQYEAATEQLMEPALSQFQEEMVALELRAIESTQRTQLFFVDPSKTKVTYGTREATVTLEGEKVKFISGRRIPSTAARYQITMTTIPHHSLNQYGIIITRVAVEDLGEIK